MNDVDQLFSLMALATLAGMLTAVAIAAVTTKRNKEEEKVWTVLKCKSCGHEERREWKEGDFVGLVEGKCPKCGAPMRVWSIYKEGGEEELEGEP